MIKSYELPAKDIIAISSCGQGWYALSRSKLKFRVWEVITGKLIGDFPMESRTDTGWLSPGGRYIMKGNECLWNIATGERCSRINVDKIEDIKDSSLSPDDRYIADAAGLYDASGEIIEPQGWRLRIREVKTGRCWFTIRVARRISATFWDGEKGWVLTAGEDRMVKIWAVNSAYHYRSPFVISRVIESAAAIKNETEFNLHLDSAKLAFQAHHFELLALFVITTVTRRPLSFGHSYTVNYLAGIWSGHGSEPLLRSPVIVPFSLLMPDTYYKPRMAASQYVMHRLGRKLTLSRHNIIKIATTL